jgi:hypothetical protein
MLSNRAFIHEHFGNLGRAIADCKEAVALSPDFLKPHYRLAKYYLRLDKIA